MKLNQLSKFTAKKLLVSESIKVIDERAKEELDGIDLDAGQLDLQVDQEEGLDIDDVDTGTEAEIDDVPVQTGFNINNVRDQLNGMVSRWFEIARSIPTEKREGFLKLGDRMDEIVKVIESEFL